MTDYRNGSVPPPGSCSGWWCCARWLLCACFYLAA